MALTDNLVAYWNLQEASGSRADAFDSQGLTDNATVTQNPGPSSIVPQAAQFTAANSEYLSHADNAALSIGDISFSVCAWVYLNSKTTFRLIASKDSSVDGGREWLLDYDSGADRFNFAIFLNGNAAGQTNRAASSLGSPSTGTWYFIVAWRDQAGGTLNIQVNNGSVDSSSDGAGSTIDTTSEFAIGRYGGGLYMDGRIAAFGLWKRALTTDERTRLYNSGAGLMYPFLLPADAVLAASASLAPTAVKAQLGSAALAASVSLIATGLKVQLGSTLLSVTALLSAIASIHLPISIVSDAVARVASVPSPAVAKKEVTL